MKRKPFDREAIAGMSAAAINKELDRVGEANSKLTDMFIAADLGHLRHSDIDARYKAGDRNPLITAHVELSERGFWLRHEVERRAGPGTHRLPRGMGPLKR